MAECAARRGIQGAHLVGHHGDSVTHCAGQGDRRLAEQGAGEDPARIHWQAAAAHAAGGATRPDSKPQRFSARGAGALGLSFLGRDHTYALDEQMRPNWPVIEAFCDKYAGQQVLLFGFTFMLWQCLLEPLRERGLQLPLTQGTLFHSGGWKKLQHLAVDNQAFKQRCHENLGLSRVHNFYGMVEQVGSVFVECEQGHLHAPLFADLLVRDPLTHRPLGVGQPGLLQVISAIPQSYPGHSLLSEDLGVLLGEDDCPCGRLGRYFHVSGRQQGAEVRGCSDTFQ